MSVQTQANDVEQISGQISGQVLEQGSAPATPMLGIAVAGAGRWGNHLIRNFLRHPQAKLVAVVDQTSDRLQTLARQYKLSPHVLRTDQWDQILALDAVDAVAIATPAITHYDLIRSALRHHKHVFVEKPITLDPKQAVELCNLAQHVNRQLIVDHTYLFNPAVAKGQELLKQHQLGPLRYGYATRTHLGPIRQDVDALWDLAIHDISIFSHWLNEFPCQVQAQGKTWIQTTRSNGHPRLFPRGLPDMVWLTLQYPSGIEVVIHLCWANPDKQRRLCLVGDQGTLVFDELNPDAPLLIRPGTIEQTEQGFIPCPHPQRSIDLEAAEPLYQACDHFLDCIYHQQASIISPGCLGAKFVEVLSALTESLNQGGLPIRLNLPA